MRGDIPAELCPADASPGDMLYVVDRHLRVVYVNDEWRSFAEANNGKRLLADGWNPQLLENFSGSEKVRWTSIYRALLSGRLPAHEEGFQCPSPVERRLFRMRIVPHCDETGAVAWLTHHAVRVDQKPASPDNLQAQLKALDTDAQVIVRAYRTHVLDRRIRPVHFVTAQHVQPLEEVGGDLLWSRVYADGTTHLVLADVVGHGLEAARLAAKIVILLDAITETRQSGPQNVARLNSLLLELDRPSVDPESQPRFTTGLYVSLSPVAQALKVCSFGHSGPIFSKAGHLAIDGGLPIGLMKEDGPWPEVTLDMATHGQRFLLFTDGMTEQFNLQGEMFGEAGLERVFQQTLELPLQQMLEHACACVESFRGRALVKDDQTMLALEAMS